MDQGYTALFDNIEGDDDECISWEEFEKFFMSAGWCDAPAVKGAAASGEDAEEAAGAAADGYAADATSRSSRHELGTTVRPSSAGAARSMTGTIRDDNGLRSSRNSLKSESGGGGGGAVFVATKTTYVIERCENEFDDVFREVYRTTAGEGTINHLSPGQSYRFRVYGRNIDGGAGAPSETVIVHALLETPPAPTVISRWPSNPIGAHAIVLQWRARRHGVTSRDSGVVKRMIGDWTGVGEEEGGVSVETAFMKYDRYAVKRVSPFHAACRLLRLYSS
jgi:hypothetical protein